MEAALPKPRVQHRAGGGVLALIFHFKMCVECFCILATTQLWSFEGASFWVILMASFLLFLIMYIDESSYLVINFLHPQV